MRRNRGGIHASEHSIEHSIPMQRREFLTATAALATAAAARPRGPQRGNYRRPTGPAAQARLVEGVPTLFDPRIKALALSAVDAARQAGANYADVRLTYTRRRDMSGEVHESEELGLSVRALVDGYWGWAATPYIAVSEAPRVAQAAVALAKGSGVHRPPRQVEWEPLPAVVDGTWASPMRRDPFTVAVEQGADWGNGMIELIEDRCDARAPRLRKAGITLTANGNPSTNGLSIVNAGVQVERQERVFASTDGSYLTQTVTTTWPQMGGVYRDHYFSVGNTQPKQAGYEYVTDTPWPALLEQALDRIDAVLLLHQLPQKPLEGGRYDVVCSAEVMAALVAGTFGPATQVDRALGYEANAGGTSYLGTDPLAVLGTPVASPLVTVTADRSAPGALATIGWDDEGVRPVDFTLIRDGVLVDWQTTREQAGWLAPYYQRQQQPVRSHGCAASYDALTPMLQHTPNLTLQPGAAALGVDELVAALDHGLLIETPQGEGLVTRVDMDFQAGSGVIPLVEVTEIRQGKRVARLVAPRSPSAEFVKCLQFPSAELWKNVTHLGGRSSMEQYFPKISAKGDPEQQVRYSVAAVPALITRQAVVNLGDV